MYTGTPMATTCTGDPSHGMVVFSYGKPAAPLAEHDLGSVYAISEGHLCVDACHRTMVTSGDKSESSGLQCPLGPGQRVTPGR